MDEEDLLDNDFEIVEHLYSDNDDEGPEIIYEPTGFPVVKHRNLLEYNLGRDDGDNVGFIRDINDMSPEEVEEAQRYLRDKLGDEMCNFLVEKKLKSLEKERCINTELSDGLVFKFDKEEALKLQWMDPIRCEDEKSSGNLPLHSLKFDIHGRCINFERPSVDVSGSDSQKCDDYYTIPDVLSLLQSSYKRQVQIGVRLLSGLLRDSIINEYYGYDYKRWNSYIYRDVDLIGKVGYVIYENVTNLGILIDSLESLSYLILRNAKLTTDANGYTDITIHEDHLYDIYNHQYGLNVYHWKYATLEMPQYLINGELNIDLIYKSPLEVQSNSPSTRRGTSTNSLPVNGKTTHRDRGKGEGVTSSGLPENDLREFEGEVNREGYHGEWKTSSGEAGGRTLGEMPSTNTSEDKDMVIGVDESVYYRALCGEFELKSITEIKSEILNISDEVPLDSKAFLMIKCNFIMKLIQIMTRFNDNLMIKIFCTRIISGFIHIFKTKLTNSLLKFKPFITFYKKLLIYLSSTICPTSQYGDSPPEVTTTSRSHAESSSNLLSLKGNATPGDRGEGNEEEQNLSTRKNVNAQPLRTGILPGGTKNVNPEEQTSSGSKKPESDLRELEGDLNRRATTASGMTYGETPSGNNCALTSSGCNEKYGDSNDIIRINLCGEVLSLIKYLCIYSEGVLDTFDDIDIVMTIKKLLTLAYGGVMYKLRLIEYPYVNEDVKTISCILVGFIEVLCIKNEYIDLLYEFIPVVEYMISMDINEVDIKFLYCILRFYHSTTNYHGYFDDYKSIFDLAIDKLQKFGNDDERINYLLKDKSSSDLNRNIIEIRNQPLTFINSSSKDSILYEIYNSYEDWHLLFVLLTSDDDLLLKALNKIGKLFKIKHHIIHKLYINYLNFTKITTEYSNFIQDYSHKITFITYLIHTPLFIEGPPEVTTSIPLAVEASSNYLSLKGNATPRDRGDVNPEEQEMSTQKNVDNQPIRTGILPGRTENVYPEEQKILTPRNVMFNPEERELHPEEQNVQPGRTKDVNPEEQNIVNGPQVEPVADLREAEGELIRRADGRMTSSVGVPCNGKEYVLDVSDMDINCKSNSGISMDIVSMVYEFMYGMYGYFDWYPSSIIFDQLVNCIINDRIVDLTLELINHLKIFLFGIYEMNEELIYSNDYIILLYKILKLKSNNPYENYFNKNNSIMNCNIIISKFITGEYDNPIVIGILMIFLSFNETSKILWSNETLILILGRNLILDNNLYIKCTSINLLNLGHIERYLCNVNDEILKLQEKLLINSFNDTDIKQFNPIIYIIIYSININYNRYELESLITKLHNKTIIKSILLNLKNEKM